MFQAIQTLQETTKKSKETEYHLLLYEFRANDPNKRGGGVMCNGFSQHGLPASRWSIHENTTRRIDTYLSVQVEMC